MKILSKHKNIVKNLIIIALLSTTVSVTYVGYNEITKKDNTISQITNQFNSFKHNSEIATDKMIEHIDSLIIANNKIKKDNGSLSNNIKSLKSQNKTKDDEINSLKDQLKKS